MSNSFNYTGSYIVAGSENESQESLSLLSKHGNPAVRRRLAENPCTPPEILEMLGTDEATEVRAALAWNIAVHFNVLERLCRDEDVNVRLALTENHNLPEELLVLLANDENPYVQHHAKRSLEVVAFEAQLTSESFCAQVGTEARLGELMVAAGMLNEQSMHAFVELAKEKKLPLGHVLILAGGLPRSIVARALGVQCRVREGSMSFDQAVAELRLSL
ncbi:MAG: hypothetical protein WC028_13010 [Candidatus Obscuribacterales bacterium]